MGARTTLISLGDSEFHFVHEHVIAKENPSISSDGEETRINQSSYFLKAGATEHVRSPHVSVPFFHTTYVGGTEGNDLTLNAYVGDVGRVRLRLLMLLECVVFVC